MSYTEFLLGTTISASEMAGNYEWVGKGNFLPRGESNLSTATDQYNLGSNAYRWNKVYLSGDIIADGYVTQCWNRIVDVTLTENTHKIEVTGLDGDTDILYKIIFQSKVPAFHSSFHFNQDSGSTYNWLRVSGYSGTIDMDWDTQDDYMEIGFNAANYNDNFNSFYVFAKSGQDRYLVWTELWGAGLETRVPYISNVIGYWSNSADNVTSMQFVGYEGIPSDADLYIDTHLQIWTLKE